MTCWRQGTPKTDPKSSYFQVSFWNLFWELQMRSAAPKVSKKGRKATPKASENDPQGATAHLTKHMAGIDPMTFGKVLFSGFFSGSLPDTDFFMFLMLLLRFGVQKVSKMGPRRCPEGPPKTSILAPWTAKVPKRVPSGCPGLKRAAKMTSKGAK